MRACRSESCGLEAAAWGLTPRVRVSVHPSVQKSACYRGFASHPDGLTLLTGQSTLLWKLRRASLHERECGVAKGLGCRCVRGQPVRHLWVPPAGTPPGSPDKGPTSAFSGPSSPRRAVSGRSAARQAGSERSAGHSLYPALKPAPLGVPFWHTPKAVFPTTKEGIWGFGTQTNSYPIDKSITFIFLYLPAVPRPTANARFFCGNGGAACDLWSRYRIDFANVFCGGRRLPPLILPSGPAGASHHRVPNTPVKSMGCREKIQ